MRLLTSALLIFAASTQLPAQTTGRILRLLAPAVVGQTLSYDVSSPGTATGNLYTVLWCDPPFQGTTTFSLPGFTVQGQVRVDPMRAVPTVFGVFGASGSPVLSLAIPSSPSSIGYAWDMQSLDLEPSTMTLSFSDNDLGIQVAGAPMAGMVAIQPGTFAMGYACPWCLFSMPLHNVTITRPFWMARHEVTQAEYLAVMNTNPSVFWNQGSSRPVETVSWHDAMAYCAALTAQEAAASRLPSGYEYRLPTEAEWEYCCRAGTTTVYSFGNTASCSLLNAGGCIGRTADVGSYPANPWGLFDMHGNVYEWCLDHLDNPMNYPSTPVRDPYVSVGADRIMRGGAWNTGFGSTLVSACRSGDRQWGSPTATGQLGGGDVGFRVVLAPIL